MDPAVILVIWVICGMFAAMIASSKGRDTGSWFILGFFFGLFALLAAIGMSTDEEAIATQRIAQGTMRNCPYCAEAIRLDAVVCRFCGRDVEPVEPTQTVYHGSPSAQLGKCSQCGGQVRSDASGCPWCGVQFAAPPETVT